MNKQTIYQQLREKYLADFTIIDSNFDKPWGGYFVIDPKQIGQFQSLFFRGVQSEQTYQNLSPKLLIVEPKQRLSWQYHHRRAELWKVLEGPVGVATSPTDEEHPPRTYQSGDLIVLGKGERHRLVGLEDRGVVAEIWQHTDPHHLSDEQDIVRVQDDFGR